MQTFQPTLRLGRDVWDRTAMPVEEFLGRVGRLRAAMSREGLDALLLWGSGLNECGHPTYLSNYIVKLPFAALVVLPREGEPALMFEGATRGRDAAKATTWIEDVRPCWNMAETCLAVLSERGLTAGVIGLAGMPRLVPQAQWARLAAGLDRATLVDAEGVVDRQRAIKSAREVALVRRASEIVRTALACPTRPTAAPGHRTESWLGASVMHEARTAGAEDIRLMVARPREGWRFRPPEEVAIGTGENVAVHLAASWERYWSEATRTFVARTDRFDPLWDADVDARFERLVGRLVPGTTIGDWVRLAYADLSSAEMRALEPCGLGHGIGVTPQEAPDLSESCVATVAPGMCMVVRAAFTRGRRRILHGDTVVVPDRS